MILATLQVAVILVALYVILEGLNTAHALRHHRKDRPNTCTSRFCHWLNGEEQP